MRRSTSLVTIGMPVHNGGAHLEEALRSLLDQEHQEIELIISDNASDDDTPSICEDHARSDSRIRYLRSDDYVEAHENFIRAFAAAEGDFFMWAAADDVHHPRFISEGLRGLLQRPDHGLAFCEIENIDENGETLRLYPSFTRFEHTSRFRRVARYLWDPEVLGKANLIYSLFRTEVCAAALRAVPFTAAWGVDMCIVLAALARTQVHVTPGELFFKRLPGTRGSPTIETDPDAHLSMAGTFQLDRDGFRYVGNCLRALRGTQLLPVGAVVMGARTAQLTSRAVRSRLRAADGS